MVRIIGYPYQRLGEGGGWEVKVHPGSQTKRGETQALKRNKSRKYIHSCLVRKV